MYKRKFQSLSWKCSPEQQEEHVSILIDLKLPVDRTAVNLSVTAGGRAGITIKLYAVPFAPRYEPAPSMLAAMNKNVQLVIKPLRRPDSRIVRV